MEYHHATAAWCTTEGLRQPATTIKQDAMARTLLVWGLDKKDVCREEDVMTEHGDYVFGF